MLNIFNYQFAVNTNPILIALALPIIILLVWYIYKYTIPQTSKIKKYTLITLRSLALLLLLLLVFDPTITKVNKIEEKAVVPVFVDNSASVKYFEQTDGIVDRLATNTDGSEIEYRFFSFGDVVKEVPKDSISNLSFNSPSTNFEQIFSSLSESNNVISAAVIVSDGIINDGSSSIYQSERINFPIYTVGVGDTTKKADTFVSSILTNSLIYKDTKTIIAAEIANQNLAGKTVSVSLLENNKIIETKQLGLSESGYDRVVFEYLPEKIGKQKISINVSSLSEEENSENNLRSKFIDVLKSKLNILIIAGAPSADLSSVNQTLNSFEDYEVNKFILVSEQNEIGENLDSKLDSAEVIVMIGFPRNNLNGEFVESVKEKIINRKTPFFFFTGPDISNVDFNSLSGLIPVAPQNVRNEIYLAQPNFVSGSSNIIAVSDLSNFNQSDLPPVIFADNNYRLDPTANMIATAKINNITTQYPLIVSSEKMGIRNITILAGNIWRWKISPNESTTNFFNLFVRNSIQWLRLRSDQRTFFVETNKDIYASGEQIKFTAELYDDKLDPVTDAEISINVTSSNDTYSTTLRHVEDGIYTGELSTSESGDVDFSAVAKRDGIKINQFNGKFNIGEVDLEKLQSVMQQNFLSLIASNSGGTYRYISESDDIFQQITNKYKDNIKVMTSSYTYNLLSNEVLLLIIIIIFSTEWFLRKREGML